MSRNFGTSSKSILSFVFYKYSCIFREDTVCTRPPHHTEPTSKLKDVDNTEKLQLAFQRKAVQDFRVCQATQAKGTTPPPSNAPSPGHLAISSKCSITDSDDGNNSGNDVEEADKQPKPGV